MMQVLGSGILKRLKDTLHVYKAAYKNWPWVLLLLLLTKRAKAITRDGRIVYGNDVIVGKAARWYLWLYSHHSDTISTTAFEKLLNLTSIIGLLNDNILSEIKMLVDNFYSIKCCRLIDISEDLSYITIEVKGRKIILHGWRNFMFKELDDYDILDVRNKVVLDVGAFVGETAIFFALKGANKVVAVEASPWAYQMAKRNVEINGLSNIITLVNCAISKDDDKILMLPTYETTPGFNTRNIIYGNTPVPTCTLDTIIEKYGPFDILKMDCEGCEYDSILYSEKLCEFKEILIEYHEGYEPILMKLLNAKFNIIKYSAQLIGGKLYDQPIDPKLGYIYAAKSIIKN